jgi:hypothetical protein
MTRALASFGVKDSAGFVPHTRPRMERYARRWGYEPCFDATTDLDPPSWGKVPLMLSLLETYDAVLWLDADILILDHSRDIAAGVPMEAAQAMVEHVTPQDGAVPNCGVWYVTRAARPLLAVLLGMFGTHRHAQWWEQSALIEVLPLGWRNVTHWLHPCWNRHRRDTTPCDRVRFLHFTDLSQRVERCGLIAEMLP